MLTSRRWFVAALTLLLPLAIISSAQAGKTLRWKLKPGDKFEVESVQSQKQIIAAGGQEFEVPNEMTMFMSWEVDKIDDKGVIHVTQTINRIKMSLKAPSQDIAYDSADPKEPEGAAKQIVAALKPLVGAKFTQQMNDQGKIIDLTVPKELIDATAGNPIAKQFFEDGGFKNMMQQSSMTFPAEAMEKGHNWNMKSENKTPVGKMIIDSKYTYDGEEKQPDGRTLDKVKVDMTLNFEDGAGALGAKLKITEQESSGTQLFDASAGHLTEAALSQKFKMEISIAGQTIVQKMENKTVLKMKPVK